MPTGAPYASAAQDDLEAGSCTRTSAAWRTSSFSGLVKNSETPHIRLISDEEGIEPEEIVEETVKEIPAEDDPDRDLLAPLQLNRGAAEFGTDFHKVMEKIFPPKVNYSPGAAHQHVSVQHHEENPCRHRKSAGAARKNEC